MSKEGELLMLFLFFNFVVAFFFFFLIFRPQHTVTGLTMDILLIYLFKLYLCECFELVSDASCNMKETPPSLIQLYCFLFFSFLFF